MAIARAQSNDDVRGLTETRVLASCLQSENDQLQRLRQLIEQAAERAGRRDLAEDVRRDARASVEALVERVRTHADRVRRCVEQTHLPEGAVTLERRSDDASPPSLAEDQGTVHQIESGTAIGAHVHVVRGERVDGSGSAPDSSVENAVRRVGARFDACHDQYIDRLVRRAGEIHLSFTAGEGGRVTRSAVEQAGPFDSTMAQCIERAALTMNIEGQRGRSVYSYVLRFDLD
jgi:hypothetical protein